MTLKTWALLALFAGNTVLSACAPAVMGAVAVGGAGAIMADKAVEEENGGDGLF